MFFNRMTLAAAILSAGIGAALTTSASAFTGGYFPGCQSSEVLSYIQKRFDWTDEKLIKRGLAISSIRHAQESRREYPSETRPIARLYCHATASMNDGRDRTMWYLIEAGMGFAGMRDNVEFCIAGLDPLKVYGAWCRSVR